MALVAEKYRTKKRSDRIEMTDEARVLKILRSEAKLSMKNVTEPIELSDSYFAHVETGRINVPDGEKLNRLLKVYSTRLGAFRERVRTVKVLKLPHTGKKSTGLGLPFVKEAISLHGGEVKLNNVSPGLEVQIFLSLT